jgi:hypothetical protein
MNLLIHDAFLFDLQSNLILNLGLLLIRFSIKVDLRLLSTCEHVQVDAGFVTLFEDFVELVSHCQHLEALKVERGLFLKSFYVSLVFELFKERVEVEP